jgi:hypothetical protein
MAAMASAKTYLFWTLFHRGSKLYIWENHFALCFNIFFRRGNYMKLKSYQEIWY